MSGHKNNPHAIVQVERAGFADGQASVKWNSWNNPGLIEEVTVDLVTNESSAAKIRLFDPKFRVIDAFTTGDTVPQAIVRVYLGYEEALGEPIFKGRMASVSRDRATTEFTVYDMAYQMKLVKRAAYKNRRNELDIIRELVTRPEYNLKFEGPEKPLVLDSHNAMMQDQQTDWEHMLECARNAGYVVYVREDTVFVKVPAKVEDPVLTINRTRDLDLLNGWRFDFKTPENQAGRPKVVKHRGRGAGGKQIEGTSTVASRGHEKLVLKQDLPAPVTKTKHETRAKAQKELDREHAFHGNIEMLYPFGRPLMDVRKTVALEEFGRLFSASPYHDLGGGYIADSVHYAFAPGKLSVDMELYRDVKE